MRIEIDEESRTNWRIKVEVCKFDISSRKLPWPILGTSDYQSFVDFYHLSPSEVKLANISPSILVIG
jgi:hypothetical protein